MVPELTLFQRVLKMHREGTTPTDQRIADHILRHRNSLCESGISDLARATDTSEASIVRYVRKIGFEGFAEFKRHAIHEVHAEMRRTAPSRDMPMHHDQQVRDLLITEWQNIVTTFQALTNNTLDHAATLIAKSQCVWTCGSGQSAILAQAASYQFALAGKKSSSFGSLPLTFLEQIELLERSTDVLLLFACVPMSNETLLLAREAKERKIATIFVSDGTESDVDSLATVHIWTASQALISSNSLIAPWLVVRALVAKSMTCGT